jgi:hypothetical protein
MICLFSYSTTTVVETYNVSLCCTLYVEYILNTDVSCVDAIVVMGDEDKVRRPIPHDTET